VSLQNLLKIGQLKTHPPDAAEVQQLLTAAGRNLADARRDPPEGAACRGCGFETELGQGGLSA